MFSSEPGRVNFVMGDVVGRGVPAVAAMSRYRNSLRALLLEGHSPGRALTILNGFNSNEPSRGAGFATVACLEYRSADRVLSWSAAGHLPALIRDRNGVRGLWETSGPPETVVKLLLQVLPGHPSEDDVAVLIAQIE